MVYIGNQSPSDYVYSWPSIKTFIIYNCEKKTIHMKLVRYFLAWTGLTVLYLLFFSQTRYIKIFTGIRKLNLHA
jgi:hypothetical protein